MSPEEQFQAKIDAEGKIHFEPSFFEDLGETYREAIERDVVKPFEEAIKQLQEPEPLGWYDIRDFLLDKAREDELITDFPGEGDMVQVLEISEGAVVSIKFDSRNSDPFDLSLDGYEEIKHAYTDLYLSNDAQAGGTIKILFARGDWEFKKTVPEIDLQGPIRNDYLEQLTDPLKIGQIIKDSHIVPHANISCEKILIHGNRRLDQIRHPSDYTFIDGRKIYTGSITALQIAALAITTAKLAAGAVTAEKIAALAITAEKIAAKTITADKYKELRNTDSFMDHDSLDPTYPFEMPFQIVSEMTSIVSVKLSFDITNFRAYAKGIPAGEGILRRAGERKLAVQKNIPIHLTPEHSAFIHIQLLYITMRRSQLTFTTKIINLCALVVDSLTHLLTTAIIIIARLVQAAPIPISAQPTTMRSKTTNTLSPSGSTRRPRVRQSTSTLTTGPGTEVPSGLIPPTSST